MADTEKSQADEVNPRHGMAQRYLKAAHQELATKEAAKPRSQRSRKPGEPVVAGLIPSISLSTVYHTIFLMMSITIASFALAWCYVLMDTFFVAGRIIAVPTGILFFAAASHASSFYLGIIETTSNGHTTPDYALGREWQDWFWTLPSTLGILVISLAVGYSLSVVDSEETLIIMAIATWIGYPIMQLSTLENAAPVAPFSIPILRTLVTHPIAWILFYVNSSIVLAVFWHLGNLMWRDPPFITVLAMGPIAAIVLFVYAWLLGQLARWLAIQGE